MIKKVCWLGLRYIKRFLVLLLWFLFSHVIPVCFNEHFPTVFGFFITRLRQLFEMFLCLLSSEGVLHMALVWHDTMSKQLKQCHCTAVPLRGIPKLERIGGTRSQRDRHVDTACSCCGVEEQAMSHRVFGMVTGHLWKGYRVCLCN